MSRLIIIVSTRFLLLVSCYPALIGNSENHREPAKLAQKAIFEYLNQPPPLINMQIGKGITKIDPLLYLRQSLTTNGKAYFDNPMHSDLLKYPLCKKTYELVIPDTFARRFRYTDEDKDYEYDYSVIHQFSPLLPTIEPNIYLMEHYIWTNTCDNTDCVRWLNRDYLKFKIEDRKVIYIESMLLRNQVDFIGFGGFPRKKMEEALPGEKIIKFGF